MMMVRTKLESSKIAGIGLFANEHIKKGQVVWEWSPELDILLTNDQINKLSTASQEQFYNYAYLDKTKGKYLLCGDDARFFNHSEQPNCLDCTDKERDITIAARDIEEGEELTCNYKVFYGDIEKHADVK